MSVSLKFRSATTASAPGQTLMGQMSHSTNHVAPKEVFLPQPEYLIANSTDFHQKFIDQSLSYPPPAISREDYIIGSSQPFNFRTSETSNKYTKCIPNPYLQTHGEVNYRMADLSVKGVDYVTQAQNYKILKQGIEKQAKKDNPSSNPIDNLIHKLDKRRFAAERLIRKYNPELYAQRMEDAFDERPIVKVPNSRIFEELDERRRFFDLEPVFMSQAREDRVNEIEKQAKLVKMQHKFRPQVENIQNFVDQTDEEIQSEQKVELSKTPQEINEVDKQLQRAHQLLQLLGEEQKIDLPPSAPVEFEKPASIRMNVTPIVGVESNSVVYNRPNSSQDLEFSDSPVQPETGWVQNVALHEPPVQTKNKKTTKLEKLMNAQESINDILIERTERQNQQQVRKPQRRNKK